jgi:gas vesicle protein
MDNNNQNNGKFFSGFLIGFIVGAAVVFFLGTKKGKRLLKTISEKGINNISNLLEKADKAEDMDEILEEKKPKKDFTSKREFAVKEIATEEKPKARRFFRGISRHVN